MVGKGKQWFPVIAPKLFGSVSLGMAHGDEINKVIGRTIEVGLFELTGNASKYYVNLHFRISSAQGDNLNTEFIGHSVTPDFISRIVQPWTSRVDYIKTMNCKDAIIKIKAVAITNRKVGKRLQKDIYKEIDRLFTEFMKNATTESFINDFISGKIQADIRREASKIYPIRVFELCKTEIRKMM